MRIIFISDNSNNNDLIRNNLEEIAEFDSIAIFNNYSSTENYISDNIIKNQLPLDLIITEDNINQENADDFYKKILFNNDTFSNNDFNLRTIPVVLLSNYINTLYSPLQLDYSDIIEKVSTDRLNLQVPSFIRVVRAWRRKVVDELTNLGINYDENNIDYSYYLLNLSKQSIYTEIISENFKFSNRKLHYDWLELNEEKIEYAIEKFLRKIKTKEGLKSRIHEKEFHDIFNKFPFLIKRDNYIQHWYEPHLPYGKNRFHIPDYTLQPNFTQISDLSLLEIKLPGQSFLTKNSFHSRPTSKLLNHIFQVKDYKEYMENDEYKVHLKKTFGYVPDKVTYNILIGRSEDKERSLELLNLRMQQMDSSNINLITYDELFDQQVKYLERIKILKV